MGQEYLIIFEDGSMGKTSKVTQDMIDAASDGFVDIINVTNMTRFYGMDKSWKSIEEVSQ